MESKEIMEEIKCPICFEIPEDKIFLCQNGHTICETCVVGLQLCPQCRVSYTAVKVRNRTLEVLLDSFRFQCSFSQRGCKQELSRKDVKNHANLCKFSGTRVKLCCEIGFQCDHIINLLDIFSAKQHLTSAHNSLIRKDLFFSMFLLKFDAAIVQKTKKRHLDSFWTPVFVDHIIITSQPSTSKTKTIPKPAGLIILSFIHGKDKSSSWMLVRLSDDKDGQQYHAQFEIKSNSKEVSSLSWRVPAINATEISKMAYQTPFRIPNNLLRQHYILKDGTLPVSIKIIPLLGKRENYTMNSKPSMLTNKLWQRTQAEFPQEQSYQESVPRDNGNTCQECGAFPMTNVKYRRLYSADNSVCDPCATKKNPLNRWYAVIRNSEHDKNHVFNLWKNKQNEFKRKGNKDYMFQGIHDFCFNEDCLMPATYTCLECENRNYCEPCSKQDCLNHLLAVFIKGSSSETIQHPGSGESQSSGSPNFSCSDCQIRTLTSGIYYLSLQIEDLRLCTTCIENNEYKNKWFALITDKKQVDVADDLWVHKIVCWSSSRIMPLQNYKVCSATRGCSGIGRFACLECDAREHYCVCAFCFVTKRYEREHLFARFVAQDDGDAADGGLGINYNEGSRRTKVKKSNCLAQ